MIAPAYFCNILDKITKLLSSKVGSLKLLETRNNGFQQFPAFEKGLSGSQGDFDGQRTQQDAQLVLYS